MLSMVERGKVKEEEVIDFINDRTCSLYLQKQLAKFEMEIYLN
jgi:hypothetical protein